MDKTTISLDLNNLKEDERATLLALVEKANKPKSKVWKPEHGNSYICINADGGLTFVSSWTNSKTDQERYQLGNVFKTEAEAKFELQRRKYLTQYKRLSIEAGELENPWNKISMHHYAYYGTESKGIEFTYLKCMHGMEIYFPTREGCENAVKTIGEENFKEYILGI